MTSDQNADHLRIGLRRFTSSLHAAEELINSFPGLTAEELAEGYQYIASYARMILEYALANDDTDHPYFMVIQDRMTKWGLDNVDNLYSWAQISDTAEYRITGNRGNVSDLVVTLQAGDVSSWSLSHTMGSLGLDSLQVQPDGHFEIIVGSTPQETNWLPNGPGASAVLVRQCLSDWESERPESLLIERIGYEGTASESATPETVGMQLQRAGRLLLASIGFWHDFMQSVPGNPGTPYPVNALTEPMLWGQATEGVPSQSLSCGIFDLAEHEALVVSLNPVECRYFGVMLGDARWFRSLDYRNRQTSLTGSQIHTSSDGRQHLVVTHTDPGVGNWLDTAGHSRGNIHLRWQGLRSTSPTQPDVRLVPLDDLSRHLPSDEPVVEETERRAVITARKRSVDRRFFP